MPSDVCASENIDDYLSSWKDFFLSTAENFIPYKVIKDTNSPPWIDGEVRHVIRKKYAALKKYRLNKTAERKLKLRSLTQSVKCF